MRLTSADTVSGVTAPVARKVLRFIQSWGYQGCPSDAVDDVDPGTIAALVTDGYLEWADDERLRTTVEGNAVAIAKFTKPVARTTAQRHLDELIARAEQVNADPVHLHCVDRIVLFGSMLDPSVDPVGDVDVAISLVDRYDDSRDRARIEAFNELRPPPSSYDFLLWLLWPETAVLRFLKGRSRVLSIADHPEAVEAWTSTREVFRRTHG